MIIDLKRLGGICKQYRVNLGYYQAHVADETGYSLENVSAFECGRNDNARILLWYFEHGMTYEYLRGVDDGKKAQTVISRGQVNK